MSLPVSQYEALLAQVRGLRRQAQHVQQLADPLLFDHSLELQDQHAKSQPTCSENLVMDPLNSPISLDCPNDTCNVEGAEGYTFQNAELSRGGASSNDTWPLEPAVWNVSAQRQTETPSAMSFASSSGAPIERSSITPDASKYTSSQQLEAKVDMVYSLLAMLGGQEHADMGETLLALSTNRESCLAMRHSGCIPLLVQMVQSDKNTETRKKASQALNNLIQSQPDEKIRKRETRILKLLETICDYMEALNDNVDFVCDTPSDDGDDRHPVQTIAHLMKLSFDEGHRQAICNLGGIHTIAKLVEAEHSIHGSAIVEPQCVLLRRYACMALTNLTFGDSGNKALLCSYKDFMRSLVTQLRSPSDELRQVTASVLRNLSWRADSSSKEILREIGSVRGLTAAAMLDNKENTLKSILSALWNLSAHCTENKSEICAVPGALSCLVGLLSYKSTTKSLAIIENSGGILRNISSQIAVRDDYREILRERNCLQILLTQLKSPSLTIVSNACGTLWNLSAKNATDQELLWELGAPNMLRSLNHSKHKMIAMGSSATLKNLLSAKPDAALPQHVDSTARSLDLPVLPTLGVRKQKALLKDLDQNLTETFDNLDRTSSTNWMKTKNFTSLNASEPSTSAVDKTCTSLPYVTASDQSPFKSDGSVIIDNDRHKIERRYKEVMDEKDHCSAEDISDSEAQQVSNRSNENNVVDSCDGIVEECRMMEKPQESIEDNTLHRVEVVKNVSEKEKKTGVVDDIQVCHKPNDRLSDGNVASTSKLPSKLSKFSAIPKSKLPSRCFVPNASFKKKNNQNVSQSKEQEEPSNSIAKQEEVSLSGNNASMNEPQGRNLTREEIIEASQVSKEDFNERDDVSTSDFLEKNSCEADYETRGTLKCVTQKAQLNFNRSISDNLNISEENNADQLSITQNLPGISDVGANSSLENAEMDTETQRNPVQKSPKEENVPIDVEKTDASAKYAADKTTLDVFDGVKNGERLERSCNDSANILDTRMLDPEAMIESLDRFTAELVSQASSHLQNRDTSMYKSGTNNTTWDEPSTSGLSPNEPTFPSISVSAPNVVTFNDDDNDKPDIASLDVTGSTMTDSLLIAMEATKIAAVFKEAADESSSANSLMSLELDRIQPPSHLNSLTNSIIGWDSKPNSPKTTRKKSLPLVKRTFQHLQHTSSADNVPAGVASLIDNAPGGVASIIDNTPGGVASSLDLRLREHSKRASYDDLENMNPPSLFNELENSLADVRTDELCNETELFESCFTHVNANDSSVFGACTENDATEFSDAASVTPIQSDVNSSSCENLSKKSRNLTSKQRRVLAKERYRTYTIAAGMIFNGDDTPEVGSTTAPEVGSTPKERRMSDRSRYETQVVDVSQLRESESDSSSPMQSPAKSRISVRKNFLQRRLNNKERFMTRTLEDNNDLHQMVEKEANKVVENLKLTKPKHEELLECETLSLVSDDEWDRRSTDSTLNYRTYHKSWGPIAQAQTGLEDTKKPKIVKPDALQHDETENVQVKGVRGRRKPLYTKTNVTPKTIKPLNVVQNIKPTSPKPKITKPKLERTISTPKSSVNASPSKLKTPKPLERQGTFTKDDEASSKIPTPSPKTTPKQSSIPRFGMFKSTSSERSPRVASAVAYNRSTSADGHETPAARKIHSSPSTHSLKTTDNAKMGAIRKTLNQRTNSNTSLNSKKQVTSKIASIWKKIEESKKKTPKNDSKKWIEAKKDDLVDDDDKKRISRLGSFIVMNENEEIGVQ